MGLGEGGGGWFLLVEELIHGINFCNGYLFTYYLVPLSMALDNAPVCLFKWKLRSKLWRWTKVRRATLRIDPWATLANTAFLNSLKREALVRAAPSANHKRVTISVDFLFRNSKIIKHSFNHRQLPINGYLYQMDTLLKRTPTSYYLWQPFFPPLVDSL